MSLRAKGCGNPIEKSQLLFPRKDNFLNEYLLIGGYAVGYYGYPRATADMDLWIAMNP